MKNLITSIFILSLITISGQGDHPEGLLKIKKEITYWDADSTIKRSVGFYNKTGWSNVGARTGKWTFWDKKGNIEESAFYWSGFRHGKTTQYYSNRKPMMEGFFYLGVPDSTFHAYYRNGNVAEKGNYAGLPDHFLDDTLNADWKIKLDHFTPKKIGEWNYFYENGKKYMTSSFTQEDTIERILFYYDTSGTATVKDGNGSIMQKYTSGKPKEEAYYKNGVKDGIFKEWNANGTIKTEGEYQDGKMHGKWTYHYFVTKQVNQIVNYKSGLKHGAFEEFLPDGTLAIKGEYGDGKKNGNWQYFFETGAKDMAGNFINDLQDGKWNYWYPNGNIYYHGNFIEGKKDSIWDFFYKTGEQWKKGNYKLNLKEGDWTTWFENGQEAMQGNFTADKENGEWSAWFDNGELKDQGSYDMAKMTGKWKGWYPNGKKRYEGPYTKDMRDGKWTFWTDKEVLKDEGSFKIFKRKGDISLSQEDGVEQSYRHGHWKSYSEIDGKLVSEGNYAYGKQDAKWQYYYPGGEIVATETNYSDGLLNGTSKTYTRRGQIQSEIGYKNNKKHGDMKVYNRKGKLVLHVVYKSGVKSKTIVMNGEEKKILYKYMKPQKKKQKKSKPPKSGSILR